jgi:hypothetical protein
MFFLINYEYQEQYTCIPEVEVVVLVDVCCVVVAAPEVAPVVVVVVVVVVVATPVVAPVVMVELNKEY